MDVQEYFDNGGYLVLNPKYNPNKKKNTEPKFVTVDYKQDNSLASKLASDYSLEGSGTQNLNDVNKYIKHGITPNSVARNIDKELAHAQSNWDKAGNMLAQTVSEVVLGTIQGIVDIPTAVADVYQRLVNNQITEYNNPISRQLDEWREKVRTETNPIYTDPDSSITNPDFGYFMSNLPSIFSSLTLLIPGAGYTKALSYTGKFLKLNKFARGIADAARLSNKTRTTIEAASKLAVNAGIQRIGENYQESRQTFNDNYKDTFDYFNTLNDNEISAIYDRNAQMFQDKGIEKGDIDGMARVIAGKAADRDFMLNAGNFIFDVIQLHGLGNIYGLGRVTATGAARKLERQTRRYAQELNKLTDKSAANVEKKIKELAGKESLWQRTKDLVHDRSIPILTGIFEESTEGIEEAVNYVSQQEGNYLGKVLAHEIEYDQDAIDSPFATANRHLAQQYISDTGLWESAVWGFIGGVAFQGLGSRANRLKMRIDRSRAQTDDTKIKDEDKRKFFDDIYTPAEIRQRNEILDRTVSLLRYNEKIDAINRGEDPTRIVIGEDGTPSFGKIESDDEKQALLSATRKQFLTDMAVRATETGSYGRLKGWIKDDNVKQVLKEKGIVTDTDEAIDSYIAEMDDVSDKFQKEINKLDRMTGRLQRDKNLGELPSEYLMIIAKENLDSRVKQETYDEELQSLQNRLTELQSAHLDRFNDITQVNARKARRQADFLDELLRRREDTRNQLDNKDQKNRAIILHNVNEIDRQIGDLLTAMSIDGNSSDSLVTTRLSLSIARSLISHSDDKSGKYKNVVKRLDDALKQMESGKYDLASALYDTKDTPKIDGLNNMAITETDSDRIEALNTQFQAILEAAKSNEKLERGIHKKEVANAAAKDEKSKQDLTDEEQLSRDIEELEGNIFAIQYLKNRESHNYIDSTDRQKFKRRVNRLDATINRMWNKLQEINDTNLNSLIDKYGDSAITDVLTNIVDMADYRYDDEGNLVEDRLNKDISDEDYGKLRDIVKATGMLFDDNGELEDYLQNKVRRRVIEKEREREESKKKEESSTTSTKPSETTISSEPISSSTITSEEPTEAPKTVKLKVGDNEYTATKIGETSYELQLNPYEASQHIDWYNNENGATADEITITDEAGNAVKRPNLKVVANPVINKDGKIVRKGVVEPYSSTKPELTPPVEESDDNSSSATSTEEESEEDKVRENEVKDNQKLADYNTAVEKASSEVIDGVEATEENRTTTCADVLLMPSEDELDKATDKQNEVINKITSRQSEVIFHKHDDTAYHVIEADGQRHSYTRVHTVIGSSFIGPSLSTDRAVAGTKVEEVFDKLIMGYNVPYSDDLGISESAYNQIKKAADYLLENRINGEIFLANNIVLFDAIGDNRIAGELDIISVDKDGKVRIYDLKTSKTPIEKGEDRTMSYNDQLSLYKYLLKKNLDIDAESIEIVNITVPTVNGTDVVEARFNETHFILGEETGISYDSSIERIAIVNSDVLKFIDNYLNTHPEYTTYSRTNLVYFINQALRNSSNLDEFLSNVGNINEVNLTDSDITTLTNIYTDYNNVEDTEDTDEEPVKELATATEAHETLVTLDEEPAEAPTNDDDDEALAPPPEMELDDDEVQFNEKLRRVDSASTESCSRIAKKLLARVKREILENEWNDATGNEKYKAILEEEINSDIDNNYNDFDEAEKEEIKNNIHSIFDQFFDNATLYKVYHSVALSSIIENSDYNQRKTVSGVLNRALSSLVDDFISNAKENMVITLADGTSHTYFSFEDLLQYCVDATNNRQVAEALYKVLKNYVENIMSNINATYHITDARNLKSGKILQDLLQSNGRQIRQAELENKATQIDTTNIPATDEDINEINNLKVGDELEYSIEGDYIWFNHNGRTVGRMAKLIRPSKGETSNYIGTIRNNMYCVSYIDNAGVERNTQKDFIDRLFGLVSTDHSDAYNDILNTVLYCLQNEIDPFKTNNKSVQQILNKLYDDLSIAGELNFDDTDNINRYKGGIIDARKTFTESSKLVTMANVLQGLMSIFDYSFNNGSTNLDVVRASIYDFINKTTATDKTTLDILTDKIGKQKVTVVGTSGYHFIPVKVKDDKQPVTAFYKPISKAISRTERTKLAISVGAHRDSDTTLICSDGTSIARNGKRGETFIVVTDPTGKKVPIHCTENYQNTANKKVKKLLLSKVDSLFKVLSDKKASNEDKAVASDKLYKIIYTLLASPSNGSRALLFNKKYYIIVNKKGSISIRLNNNGTNTNGEEKEDSVYLTLYRNSKTNTVNVRSGSINGMLHTNDPAMNNIRQQLNSLIDTAFAEDEDSGLNLNTRFIDEFESKVSDVDEDGNAREIRNGIRHSPTGGLEFVIDDTVIALKGNNYAEMLVENDLLKVNARSVKGSIFERNSPVAKVKVAFTNAEISEKENAEESTVEHDIKVKSAKELRHDRIVEILNKDNNTEETGNINELIKNILSDNVDEYNVINNILKSLNILQNNIIFANDTLTKMYADSIGYKGDIKNVPAFTLMNTEGNNIIYVTSTWLAMATHENLKVRQEAIRKLIHERLHNIIAENKGENKRFVQKIRDVYNEFVAYCNDPKNNVPDNIKQYTFEHAYDNEDRKLEEFLVESLTSLNLINALNNIAVNDGTADLNNVKEKSLFNRIIDALLELFGIDINNNTLYAKEFIALSEEFSKVDNSEESSIGSATTNSEESSTNVSEEAINRAKEELGDEYDPNEEDEAFSSIIENSDILDSAINERGDEISNVRDYVEQFSEADKQYINEAIDNGEIEISCKI